MVIRTGSGGSSKGALESVHWKNAVHRLVIFSVCVCVCFCACLEVDLHFTKHVSRVRTPHKKELHNERRLTMPDLPRFVRSGVYQCDPTHHLQHFCFWFGLRGYMLAHAYVFSFEQLSCR